MPALVGAQKIGGEQFVVKLLHTWQNDLQLDDKAIANDLADYARKYPTEHVLYSRKTSAAVAARLAPAGIPILTWTASIRRRVTKCSARSIAVVETQGTKSIVRRSVGCRSVATR
jgi:hypothetical protein